MNENVVTHIQKQKLAKKNYIQYNFVEGGIAIVIVLIIPIWQCR